MTAGIPGVGIGGIFYLLSALAMPFHEAWLAIQGRSAAASRRLAIRQASIAVGILASMWGTAALLEFVVKTVSALTAVASTGIDDHVSREVPRLLSYSAFALSITTLIAVLTLTQLLRLLVPRRRNGLISKVADSKVVGPIHWRILPNVSSLAESGRSIILLLILLVAQPTLVARPNQDFDGNPTDQMEQHLAAADSAFADENFATAEREYRAVLELDPDQSRATFRLAQLLERTDRAESEKLYRRYQDLEPTDAWGHIVLAELLGREDRYGDALDEYAEAIRIAPEERDAVVGQARMLGRSGRTDQAIERYERWLASHPDDGEGWQDLSRERWRAGKPKGAYFALEQAAAGSAAEETSASEEIEERRELFRRSAAPAVEPLFSFGGDSDGNTQIRAGVQGDFAVADGARLGVLVGRSRIADSVSTRSFTDFGATARWRPRAAFELDAMGGAARRSSLRDENGVLHPEEIVPIARVRARAVASGGMARLDVRFNRSLLDATPTLVANQIVRNEVRVRPEFAPIRRFKIRALGGIGSIHGGGERNTRNTFGGGVGWNIAPSIELSGNYTLTGYSSPSRVGYFAPDRIQSADAGSYMEFESRVGLIVVDFGAGAERVKGHGEVYGAWRRSLRAYGMFSFPLRPGRELRLELEGYDTQAGPLVAPTSGWKYGSVAGSFRWALP